MTSPHFTLFPTHEVRVEMDLDLGPAGRKRIGGAFRLPADPYGDSRRDLTVITGGMEQILRQMEDRVREALVLPTVAEDRKREHLEALRRRASEFFYATAGPMIQRWDRTPMSAPETEDYPLGEVMG